MSVHQLGESYHTSLCSENFFILYLSSIYVYGSMNCKYSLPPVSINEQDTVEQSSPLCVF
jgi:hypothetical protein